MKFLKPILLSLILLFPAGSYSILKSQSLTDSRTSSYYTYIYRITPKEAISLNRKKEKNFKAEYLHTLVDSFPTDGQYTGNLQTGYYLKTFSTKDIQSVELFPISAFRIFVLNNNTDLNIHLTDLKGSIITDAKVKLDQKLLRFYPETQAYTDRRSNRKGILKVQYKENTEYFLITRNFNNSLIKRSTRKILYRTPVKYIWKPINFALHLPVDGVKSINRGWAQGTIYQTRKFFSDGFRDFACHFDDSYCDYYPYSRFYSKHHAYLVFNKPKYMPGDTVKFKSFIVNSRGTLPNREMKVMLDKGNQMVEIATLPAYSKGGYSYQFYLHDSLKLQLDKDYTVCLAKRKNKVYVASSFRYEDYELSQNKLDVDIKNNIQYKGDSMEFILRGKDENDLNLPDARVEVLVLPTEVHNFFDDAVFLQDTLFRTEKKLVPSGTTSIIISDTLFPKANFSYEARFRMLTSDNQVVEERRSFEYYYLQLSFEMEDLEDTFRIHFRENGIKTEKIAKVEAFDSFGNSEILYHGLLPANLPVNPYHSTYKISSGSFEQKFELANYPSKIECASARKADSFNVKMSNPRNIPFSYSLFKKNRRMDEGYSTQLELSKKIRSNSNLFVSLRYLWAGEVRNETYKIALEDQKLHITLSQPVIVYPGQMSKIGLKVTDYKGRKVEGADVTAFALTKKFGYNPPLLSYPEKARKNMELINTFKVGELNSAPFSVKLNYDTWKALANIDSIEYYRFLYPGNSLYRFSCPSQNRITQFAPYVLKNGQVEPLQAVYVDNRPVYIGWTNNTQPYSFRVDTGYHTVKLRTKTKEIIIYKLKFEEGLKTIISLDHEIKGPNIISKMVKPEFNSYEKDLLFRYTFPYRNNFREGYAYAENNGNIFLLSPQKGRQNYNNLAGPVAGMVNFELTDGYRTSFMHEPYFEYDFAPQLLKMRSFDRKRLPDKCHASQEVLLKDQVLTREIVLEKWKNYLDEKRKMYPKYSNPSTTSPGRGRVSIHLQHEISDTMATLLNIVLMREDNPYYTRVYSGNIRIFHDLYPGYYRMIFFYPGSNYHLVDSLSVRADGLNCFSISIPAKLKQDQFSREVNQLIEKTVFDNSGMTGTESVVREISKIHLRNFEYEGEGDVLEGYVFDEDTNESILGANVIVIGTSIGTVTDIEGYYRLIVPPGYKEIRYSFIGYEVFDAEVQGAGRLDVALKQNYMSLDEVVVVGYGIQRKNDMTASVRTMAGANLLANSPGVNLNETMALQGRVSGVQIIKNTGDSGSGVELRIRGVSSVSFDQEPLYIINGKVFTGDPSEIDPSMVKAITVLKDTEAVALYGSRGANGVILIETDNDNVIISAVKQEKGAEFQQDFYMNAMQSGSIRDNFCDYAFWQPTLRTDKEGKVSFDVKFPDDITSWDTHYMVMNGKRQAGQISSNIKSYKPVIARLSVPRFLIAADTTVVIGKAVNYNSDSLKASTSFVQGNRVIDSGSKNFTDFITDSLILTAIDSIEVTYKLSLDWGYFDGEKRIIPVYPKGMEVARGNFNVLENDTSFTIIADLEPGKTKIYARADILDIIEDEVAHLYFYSWFCNEQIASKLKALLVAKEIAVLKNIDFKFDSDVKKLIHLLEKNQSKDGLWGWWKDSESSEWISLHVIEALSMAEKNGYFHSIDKNRIAESLVWKLENTQEFESRVRILRMLKEMDMSFHYPHYILDLERKGTKNLHELLRLMELKQICKISVETDTLKRFSKTSLFGNLYYTDKSADDLVYRNDFQNTIIAYRVLKADSCDHSSEMQKIRNYFLEKRSGGFWSNTYESAQVIQTLFSEIIAEGRAIQNPQLEISGDHNIKVNKFPLDIELKPGDSVNVVKTGDMPVYFASYKNYWDSMPVYSGNDFEINTFFEGKPDGRLKVGDETTLVTNLKVLKSCEYLMVEIPIPAGCSYSDKDPLRNRNEVHREYYRNKTCIFIEKVEPGTYTYSINLIPRYAGSYSMNPAKVELMYFPMFRANNEIKNVRIGTETE